MAPQTSAELLDWLGDRQFLEPAQVDALRPLLPQLGDARGLARELLQRDWLTAYQANQVLQGKGEQLVLGPYRVRERLAEGAMGQVVKAYHPRLHKTVAIKTLHLQLGANSRARDRFQRELRLAAQLDHPNIIRARDADEVDGKAFLVMDYVEGTDLSTLIKQQGPLPVAEAVEYIRQAALGLQHAFERGIVHRDIKPSNLMLVPAESRPLIKILDFGLARFQNDDDAKEVRLTQFGKLLGTVDYIAPEQAAEARSADIRADIYSLGCTLYYLLSGQAPFLGSDLVEKVLARQEGEPPGIRALRPDVPVALEEILLKMMARRPEDRYQTPGALAAALEPFTPAPAEAATIAFEGNGPAAPPFEVPEFVPVEEAPPAEVPAGEATQFVDDGELGFELGRAPAAPPAPRRPPARRSRHWLWIGAGVLALVLLAGSAVLFLLPGAKTAAKKGSPPPGAALHLQSARLSVGDAALRPGEWKPILIEIRREKFEGPVKVYIDSNSLPEALSATPLTLPEKKTKGDLKLTVMNGAVPGRRELRVIAVAENLHDEVMLPVTIGGR